MNVFEYGVIGLGSVGSAVLYHLSKTGSSVIGLDSEEVPNSVSSHSGDTRLIRMAYFEHPDYVPLLKRAYKNWDQLERMTGTRIFEKTGLSYYGPSNHELLEGVRTSASLYDIPIMSTSIDADGPFFLREGYVKLFEENAGFIYLNRAITSYLKLSSENKAVIDQSFKVLSIEKCEGYYLIHSGNKTIRCKKLIVTAGAGNQDLLRPISKKLEVTEQWLAWFEGDDEVFKSQKFGCWGYVESGSDDLIYGFPYLSKNDGITTEGLKIAIHKRGMLLSNIEDRNNEDYRTSVEKELQEACKRIFKISPGNIIKMKSCLYTYSPDQDFIIDFTSEDRDAVFAAGLSGHGFKFASALGEVLSQMLIKKTTFLKSSFLRIDED